MTTLGVFLIAVGGADIVRRLAGRLAPSLVIGPVLVAACAALAGLWQGGDIALLAVAAAKGIIRFPELSAHRTEGTGSGIDEVTEYFLVGSFASWLVALAGLALAH